MRRQKNQNLFFVGTDNAAYLRDSDFCHSMNYSVSFRKCNTVKA